jgi:hypothetical protein
VDFQIFLVGDAQISGSTSSATGLKSEGGNSMLALLKCKLWSIR